MILPHFLVSLWFLCCALCSPVNNARDPYPPSECGITNATIYNRIIGAGEAGPGEWPWMAYVNYGPSFCGGVLVDRIHILTAAHCVLSYARIKQIKLGDIMRGKGITRNVLKAVIHPGYKIYWDLPDQPSINDLAILTLEHPVWFSETISPICLPERYRSYSGEIVTTVGYGGIGPGGPNSDVLRTMSGPVWDNNACQVRHDRAPVLDSHICFGEPGRSSCHGDSGSPLMVNENGRWYHIGITGWGREVRTANRYYNTDCDPAYPTVYARVTSYLPWILENLKT